MSRRVVITGMGWITPLGFDLETVWAALLASRCGVGRITHFDASSFETDFAAEVRGFQLDRFLANGERFAQAGPSSRFALAAAANAVRQAGLDKKPVNPRRIGVYLGAGESSPDVEALAHANIAAWDASTRSVREADWSRDALSRMNGRRDVEQEPNLTVARLANEFGCRGPAFNCMTACAAGTQAVGEAFEIIKRGDADAMLAGGAHSMIHPLGMTGFIRLTAMSTRRDNPLTAARPFDQTRDGFVMGEGAGILVLEELGHALARGAEPLCEVAGYGSSADAFRITDIQPEGKGAQAAMQQACSQAGINPREPRSDGRPQVQYISAHGTGTKENDRIETKAVKGVFGPMAPKVPFTSVKSMLGHLIQAAGAVELITCVMAIKTGWVPPTINLHNPDPECDLDYVPNTARDCRESGGVDVCLSNSFGFGGQNNSILVRRFARA
ncbi:MAG: beta-ketoacyl-[acyl-carrier-protein] synthase family protein [Phycisphaerales bacterium]